MSASLPSVTGPAHESPRLDRWSTRQEQRAQKDETPASARRRGYRVETIHDYSKNSNVIAPALRDLEKLAVLAASAPEPAAETGSPAWRLSRRLGTGLRAEIAEKYRGGATTPALCEEYGLSKTGILKLLRDEGADLRRRPLTPEQVALAVGLYESGTPLLEVAARLGTGPSNVRQRLLKAGVVMRPRGGSRPRA